MIWIVATLAAVMIAIPLVILWGFGQIEKIGFDEVDWKDD